MKSVMMGVMLILIIKRNVTAVIERTSLVSELLYL